MLQNITYFPIFGLPLIVYLGILTLFSFLLTASIALMNIKGKNWIPFKWHSRLAIFSICLAIIHGALAILVYF